MRTAGERRLRDGVTVAVHRNAGLRKVCGCPRRGWAKCPHPWHFNFSWRGTAYRFSLKQYAGKEVTAKSEAERLAQNLRDQIRTGIFRVSASPTGNIALEPAKRRFVWDVCSTFHRAIQQRPRQSIVAGRCVHGEPSRVFPDDRRPTARRKCCSAGYGR